MVSHAKRYPKTKTLMNLFIKDLLNIQNKDCLLPSEEIAISQLTLAPDLRIWCAGYISPIDVVSLYHRLNFLQKQELIYCVSIMLPTYGVATYGHQKHIVLTLAPISSVILQAYKAGIDVTQWLAISL